MGSCSELNELVSTKLDFSSRPSELNWRKSDVDFETMAIVETIDSESFDKMTLFMPPIVTSTVFSTTVECRLDPNSDTPHVYSRYSNPTRTHLESALAKFEGANYGLVFSSGMAAIAAIFQACEKDDHVVYVQSISGDTDWLFKNKLSNLGINCDEVISRDTNEIISKVNQRTKVIMFECPSNPILEVIDISAISIEVKKIRNDILIVVDNTILTPIFQRPLELGADVVVYSLTKYFAGHSDIVMGSIMCNSKELHESYQKCQIFFGAVPSPFDCYLMTRSLKTLPLRMKQHFSSAMKIAQFLHSHPAVTKVFYPGLPSHPQHELALKQQSGCSGLIAFYIKGSLPDAVVFIKALKYFRFGGSFASDVSIAVIPSITSQRQMKPEKRRALGIEENLIRISVGLERVETLIQDLDQALVKALSVNPIKIDVNSTSVFLST